MAKKRSPPPGKLTYKTTGVDISANDRMVEKIAQAVRRIYDPRVIPRHGAFAGLMRLDFTERLLRRRYRDPVLVGGADGVGYQATQLSRTNTRWFLVRRMIQQAVV